MSDQRVHRRTVLATGSALLGSGLAGCLDGELAENTTDTKQMEGMAVTDLGDTDSTFTVRPYGPGIDFEPLVDIDGEYTPEGLTYHDGALYAGERDGPATIREYEIDGTATGEAFTFDDVQVDHTNTMDWVDGQLWVSDSSTMKTYIVDWDEKSIVDEFDQAGVVTGTWRVIVPTSDGGRKLVFNEWRGSRAWIVDLEETVADGTTSGNVDREVKNGFWTNPQTMEWYEGALYTTTHSWIVKSRLPYADQLGDDYPVTSANVEWAVEFEDGSTLEQLVFNPDEREFYLADRGGLGTIYRGTETYGEHRNRSFAKWDTTDGGIDSERVLRVDEPGIETLELTRGSGERKVGWVDVRFYDTSSDRNEVSVGVVTNGNERIGLGLWAERKFAGERYAYYDGDEWHDASVDRVPGGWVGFGWSIHEERISSYVSRSHGRTWERVATESRDDATVNRLFVRNRSGLALVGDWTIDLRSAD